VRGAQGERRDLARVRRRPKSVVSALIDTVTPHLCSLGDNQLCGLAYDGYYGDHTADGITKLCEGLKGSAVTSLKCAASPECSPFCQRPLTYLQTFSPAFLCTFPPASFPFRVPFRTHSLLGLQSFLCTRSQKHTHPFSTPTRDAALHRAPRETAALPPVGRVGGACSRARLTPPATSLRHSLSFNNLDEKAKKAVKDAAGSGVSITF